MKKKKTMRAIKIDVKARTITEVEVSGLEDMQAVVEGFIECAFELENGDQVYVNEEGLLTEPPRDYFFIIGAPHPFAGNGLVIGLSTKTGDTIPAASLLEIVKMKVVFLNEKAVQALVRGK